MSDGTWRTVAEARTKMLFDSDGDSFEGTYEGPEEITDPNTQEVYTYLNFRAPDGEAITTSASYQLEKAFARIGLGEYVKITRMSQVAAKTGKMTNFKVQVRD